MKNQCQALAVLVVIAGILLAPRFSDACSCEYPLLTTKQKYADVEVVFQGVAEEVRIPLVHQHAWLDEIPLVRADVANVKTTFRVTRAWKGVEGTRIVVLSGSGRDTCSWGDVFSPGGESVIFASQYKGKAYVGHCSGSRFDPDALKDTLAFMGPGTTDLKRAPWYSGVPLMVIGITVVLLVMFGALVVLLLVRRRRGGAKAA